MLCVAHYYHFCNRKSFWNQRPPLLSKAGEEWESQTGIRPSLEALINTVSEAFDLSSQ